MDLNKASKLKDRVIALERILKEINHLKEHKNDIDKIIFYDCDDKVMHDIIQPFEMEEIIDFIIAKNTAIEKEIENQIKDNY